MKDFLNQLQSEVAGCENVSWKICDPRIDHTPLLEVSRLFGKLEEAYSKLDYDEMKDAVAATVVHLADYCYRRGFSLGDCVSLGNVDFHRNYQQLYVIFADLAYTHLEYGRIRDGDDDDDDDGENKKDKLRLDAQKAIGSIVIALDVFFKFQGDSFKKSIKRVWESMKSEFVEESELEILEESESKSAIAVAT